MKDFGHGIIDSGDGQIEEKVREQFQLELVGCVRVGQFQLGGFGGEETQPEEQEKFRRRQPEAQEEARQFRFGRGIGQRCGRGNVGQEEAQEA